MKNFKLLLYFILLYSIFSCAVRQQPNPQYVEFEGVITKVYKTRNYVVAFEIQDAKTKKVTKICNVNLKINSFVINDFCKITTKKITIENLEQYDFDSAICLPKNFKR